MLPKPLPKLHNHQAVHDQVLPVKKQTAKQPTNQPTISFYKILNRNSYVEKQKTLTIKHYSHRYKTRGICIKGIKAVKTVAWWQDQWPFFYGGAEEIGAPKGASQD